MQFGVNLSGEADDERTCRGVAIEPVSSTIQQLMTRDDEPYLAVVVRPETLCVYLQQLCEYLGEAVYRRYTTNRKLRDGVQYHITVVGPAELERLVKSGAAVSLTEQPMQYCFVGLGSARLGSDTAYFIVCESEELQQFRAGQGLGWKDLHVTLGFDLVDVHDVVKDETTLVELD